LKKGHYASVCKSRSTVREVEDYGFLGEVNSNNSEPWIINLKVKDTDIQFKIDTGAVLSVVLEYVFKKLKNIRLVKADKILFGPGQKQLQVLGTFKCELKAKTAKSNQELYVVKGLRNSLLGRTAIQSLGLLLKSDVKNVDTVQEQYSELFSGLGKTDWEYTIKLKPGYVPFALSTPRRVPLPLMEKMKKELSKNGKYGCYFSSG
jgi:hypothetical protein